MQNDIAYIAVMTEAEYTKEFENTKDTPYLTLTGERWGVFCKYFSENWQRYNGMALYHVPCSAQLDWFFFFNEIRKTNLTKA